jgi:tetratricopeptide (TPR) repeat protein
LLKLWEGNPDKREQAAHIYETILERHPDNTELRKKLGDLYRQMGDTEDMVRHYLELYKASDDWKGTSLEKALVEGLDKLHRQYARQKDYDKAIKTYNVLASIDPTTDPTAVIYYQYLKQASDLKPGDTAGRLALAQYAEKYGLDQEALDRYKQLLSEPATHDAALAGYTRYAQKALAMAQLQFDARNYSLSRTLADQVRKDFPQSTDVSEKAAEIIGKAQVEMANERRQNAEQAKDLVKAGDEYYAQADSHFQALFSNQRSTNPLLMNDREEAKRYYTLAIQCYSQALAVDSSLARNPGSLVVVRLGECKTRLASLNQNILNSLGRINPPFISNESPSSNF